MNETIYTYKQKPLPAIFGILFFVLCTYFLAKKASNNSQGLILNHIIEFSASGATNFYWALTFCSVIFVTLGAFLLIQSIFNSSTIKLTSQSMIAPTNGLRTKLVEIPYSSIQRIQIQSVQKQKFLHIFYLGGKHSLIQARFRNNEEFEMLINTISSRIKR
jgi:uncharacterized membrane protein